MVLRGSNSWETEDRADLVDIGTHKLHISTSGPPRRHGKPVVIFFSAGGAPCAVYCRLQQLLSAHARVYFYDRSGYNRSENGPNEKLFAWDAARELERLLKQIDVQPPYLLVGHSYGCIVARTYLDQAWPGIVVGMVLAEAATELMFQVFPVFPDPAMDVIAAGLDYAELTDLKRESGMTDEQWHAALEGVQRSQDAALAEDSRASATRLAQSRQFTSHMLSPWPLSVIRCDFAKSWRILYDAGVAKGHGTSEQRAQARAFIETIEMFDDELRAGQLRLSSCNRYVTILDQAHDGILRKPETVAEEVLWVLDRAAEVGSQSPYTPVTTST